MKRREALLVFGIAALWPIASTAQQRDVYRIGVIMASGRTAEYAAALAEFERVLASVGWKQDSNLRIDYRWSSGTSERTRAAAVQEILALNPDVILGQSATVIEALLAATHTIPIVFVHVADPVASGFVPNLARPGGNLTGFINTEPSIGGKWLQLLKEAAPAISRAAMLVNPDTQTDGGALYRDPFMAAAQVLGMTAIRGDVRDLEGIEAILSSLAGEPRGGFVVIPDAFFAGHSAQIVALAKRFKLPGVYPYRYYIEAGGLLSYGVNNVDLFRQAAPYVDRILRGEKAGDLPVQLPSHFALTINATTAKELGLPLSQVLLARADEVIE
jgi:putative tryptophan/tyrosine transport system substrate-binding protein